MKIVSLLASGLVLAFAPSAAAAEKPPVFVEARPVKDKPAAVILSPDKAYVMIRAGKAGASFMFMKEPDAEDQAAYDRLRADALATERKRHARRMAGYERDLADWEKGRSDVQRPAKPVRPIEPTAENFEITPFPVLAQVPIGPVNRFAKGEESVYLHELTPGTYRLYGPVFVSPQGPMAGVCYCMGSVRFTAHAGAIVDLGRAAEPEIVKPAAGDSASPLATSAFTFRLAPVTPDMPVDPRLKGVPIRPAEYRAAGKLPNYFGLAIDRLAPIPGVLDYDRDRIVDPVAPAGQSGRR